MGLFNWLNRNRINPSDKKQNWEDTDEGKDFTEKYKVGLEKRKLLKEEWERTTPPEKKEQVKLFQVIFPIFFLGYVAALFWGFKTNKELMVLACTCCISLISLVLFFIKPKFVKYPKSYSSFLKSKEFDSFKNLIIKYINLLKANGIAIIKNKIDSENN